MRRGQLLSIDALLSLVIVVMVVGVVMNTNDMIRAEITNLLDWYDRANIANNMLDVLTKRPGYPEDWESNVSSVKMVGLRDKKYPFALSYEKIIALNRSKEEFKDIFNQLARGKDFLFELYVSKFNVSIEGRFPRVYINNVTFRGIRGSQQVNFEIRNAEQGPPQFTVVTIMLERNGTTYTNEEVCDVIYNQPGGGSEGSGSHQFEIGDIITIIPNENVEVWAQLHGEQFSKIIPARSAIEIVILETTSNFDLYDNKNDCYIDAHVTGHGQILVRVFAYDSTFPILNSSYTSARDFLEGAEPLYWFSLINGTFEENMSKVRGSMSNSPWIEPVERAMVFPKFTYNLSSGPSAEEPLIYGFMKYNPLKGTSIRIRVNSSSYGNLTLLSQLGTEIRGFFIYGNSTDLNATLVWYENGTAKVKGYEGVNGTITMPFEDLFGSSNTINKLIGLWLYSLEGWKRGNVTIEIIPSIEYMLDPKFESVILKLWVWDDR